ncbi:MAG TPA: GDP-mannose 4,6-dehydratase [Candidatus Nanoarchaeia archaeon]|nr:GDP-mannose 4,6-dehydratase [Candidatus Nanoarchaeia archaeon]
MLEFNFRRVLITGVSGSGGSYLAEHLVNNYPSAEVCGITRWHSTTSRDNLEAIANKVKIHECDLTDAFSVLRTLRKVNPDAIFHLAAYANVKAAFDYPLAVSENNIKGTLNLLEAVRFLNETEIIKNPRIMIASTPEVYGQPDKKHIPITEECPIDPVNPYAVSKTMQDIWGKMSNKSYGLDVIRTRMFTYINPRRTDLFATSFAMQVARIEKGLQKEMLHGNLESTRTILDVRDAMEAYCYAIAKGEPGEAYNIAGTTTMKVGDVLEVLKRKAKCDIPTRLNPELLRPTDVTLQIPSTEKFMRKTGWKPKYSFEESIEFLLDHCRREVEKEEAIKKISEKYRDGGV